MPVIQIGNPEEPARISAEDFQTFIRVGRQLADLAGTQVGADYPQVSVERDGTVRFFDDDADLIGDDLVFVDQDDYEDYEEYAASLGHYVAQAINGFS